MSNSNQYKGYEEREGVNTKKLNRDTRKLTTQIVEIYSDPFNCDLSLILSVVFCFIFPSFYLLFILNLIFTTTIHLWVTRRDVLPMEMPVSYGGTDYHNKETGGKNRYRKAEGRYYYGNSLDGNGELWASFRRVINHLLAFGATGSGKTEFLIAVAFNALATASGFIYIDPKAAGTLYPKLYTVCRRFARDDDVRLLAFHIKKKKKSKQKITNSINIVNTGSADELANLFISLAPNEKDSKNAIFFQKGQNLIRSFLICWVELRDYGLTPGSIESIRQGLSLQNCITLTQDQRISEGSRKSISSFIKSLGHQETDTPNEASSSVADQFGFAISYFSNTLNLIADSYGHMFDNKRGEVNIKDTIIRKRIMIGAIPSLGLSDAVVKIVGQITLTQIRLSIGDCIAPIESHTIKEEKQRRKAFLPIIVDEYAAIGVADFITTITQARFLDIAAIIGAQDYAGLKRIDAYGAEQLAENTRFKAFFRLETGKDTFKMAQEIAGDITVLETTGYEIKGDGLGLQYYDKQSVSKQTRNRINLQDLIAQTEGEFHGLYNGMLFRAYSFFIDIEPKVNASIRIHHLVQPRIIKQEKPSEQRAVNSIKKCSIETVETEGINESIRQEIYEELVVAWEIGHDPDAIKELKRYINDL